jgi:23S rRNA pseudouridine2605 synthase
MRRRERTTQPGVVSLERALSKLGLASRAEARRLIVAGRVRVNDRTVTDPAMRVTPERVRLAIDGAAAPARREAVRVVALHKPRGAVTTRRDPQGRQTVFDVLGPAGDGLIAVGRLDAASTGLLIFTNDTQLAHRLTDPASRTVRRYVVTVRGRLTPASLRRLEAGLDVAGARGTRETLRVERAALHKASGRESHALVDLTEGRNREIRRLFAALGHDVTRVHRIAFGPYELGNLQPGEWRSV